MTAGSRPTTFRSRMTAFCGRPWLRVSGAALCLVKGMAALGYGFGVVFLGQQQSPERAAVGFALIGVAVLYFAATAKLAGFLRRE